MVEPAELIRLRGIRFGYDHHRPPVLESLDFTFRSDQRAGLVGPNGSGKTTLVHIIMGLLIPEAGRVEILGRERRKEADFREVRAGIGFVFQDADDQLFCPTVAEDVAFGPLNLGATHAQARAVVEETLDRLGLAGFGDRVTYKLSGGEKKLVSLATVLAMKPRMLLLDEPTTGLDEETTRRIAGVIRELGLPYLIVSHDREFLARTTDSTFRMRGGRVEESGPVSPPAPL
ncbi:MAG: energy-coupling factor ABC transporter ATP-binding protein [Proteobacteria bacterium]|nr:energy-coupling factor ABC transporter ATP-binding protein [Pseudomonadota bacterium]